MPSAGASNRQNPSGGRRVCGSNSPPQPQGLFLEAFEAIHPAGATAGSAPLAQTGVITISTETAGSIAGLDTYAHSRVRYRLKGLMWGAEDLSGDISALANKFEVSNKWSAPFAYARTRCLIAAAAAGVPVINEAMTPEAQAQAQAWASQVVAVFAASAADGVATLEGKMLDTPYLRLAQKILAAASSSQP